MMQTSKLFSALAILLLASPSFAANPSLGSSETSNVKVCLEYQRNYEDLAKICELAGSDSALDAKTKLQVHRHLGDALENLGRIEDARAQYQIASAIDPLDARPIRDMGWSYWGTSEFDAAIGAFEAAIAIEADASSYAGLASSLRNKEGPIDRVLELLDRSLLINPESTWALVERGWYFSDTGRSSDALSDFDRAIDIDSDLSDAFYGKAWVYDSLDDHDASLKAINEALLRNPDYHVYFGFRAYLMRSTEKFRAAIANAAKALEVKPGYAYAALQMALSQDSLGFANSAIYTLERALESGAGGNSFFYTYADLLSENDDWQGALEKINRALDYTDANEFDFNLKSYILLQLGREQDALSSARAAQGFQPDFSPASLNACYANIALGDEDAALEDLKQAKRFGASSADVNSVIKYLVNLEKFETAARFRLALTDD